tara:strand:+ start:80492 stop:80776 length:285 start_codon:yes stop_codon:yes gene_type:complete
MNLKKSSVLSDGKTLAWLLLMVATGAGWWLGQAGHGNTQAVHLATAGVVVVAFTKVWIVGFEFMELRYAPRWLRYSFDAWIIAVCLALLSICLR